MFFFKVKNRKIKKEVRSHGLPHLRTTWSASSRKGSCEDHNSFKCNYRLAHYFLKNKIIGRVVVQYSLISVIMMDRKTYFFIFLLKMPRKYHKHLNKLINSLKKPKSSQKPKNFLILDLDF
jgi:hypothetical protein